MANAAAASIYEIITIDKNGKKVRLEGKTTSFDYYESLLSPNITATMTFIDTGGSVETNNKYDPQERLGTVYNGLPITGLEKLQFKIKSKLGDLDFSINPLYVNGALSPTEDSNRQSVVLDLVSKAAITNRESTVFAKFKSRISDSVKIILSTYLQIPEDKIKIDSTKNSYNFLGNSRNPFEILCSLGPKSVPTIGNPGYFFYETREGFNYKSIDSLIAQPAKATYFRTDVLNSGVKTDENDYKISTFSINKNQNMVNALKSGVYTSRNIFFDPRIFKYTEIIYKLSQKNLEKSLGKDAEIPTENNFTRTHYHIVDIGTLEKTVPGEINNDPREYQAASTMRYNLLLNQVINMTVPCNPKLMAGDIIRCEFEMVTKDSKEQGYMDPTQSGNYLIMNLCHHFDSKRSFTSMTLVRDTYGLYTNKRI